MGNWISQKIKGLETFAFKRRGKNIANRSDPNHPENCSPDQSITTTNVEQIPTSQSVLLPTTTNSSVTNPTVEATKSQIEELAAPKIKVTMTSSNKCSDLYLACRNNKITEVENLLEKIERQDIDRVEPNGSTALHAASYHGHVEIVKLLLEAGADRTIQNKYNNLPFDEAKNDEIKKLFFRIPTSSRLVSDTGAVEWQLIDDDDILDKAAEERKIIKSLYSTNSIAKMFERIEKNYISKSLVHFNRIEQIKRFFRRAIEEENPLWIIKAYTAETDFYKVFNKELAGGGNKCLSERRYIIALLSHHPKLDEFSFIGMSYRTMQMTDDDLRKYQVGCSLMTKSFLSSSIEEKLAVLFLYQQELARKESGENDRLKSDGKKIKQWVMCTYQIKHRRTALYIENTSQYAMEGEILIMPYTVFRVKKMESVKRPELSDEDFPTIELEECDQYLDI
ncbi:unnamed protein product [Rotaria sp. Silwood1]|nr:unnamed protein product [Rotaria sp. Silwood1]CAF3597725.1 unnamed protein product [Rotaria sp. Silwood1]CAF3640179.1 unnamed protein product [Rotaria sp. Silwood1]CAF3655704.1 unnamed protein product [Rotaria sp. Silwood1]CAF3680023.1 unnamed protein product [Rotaria sp. Silwood1]